MYYAKQIIMYMQIFINQIFTYSWKFLIWRLLNPLDSKKTLVYTNRNVLAGSLACLLSLTVLSDGTYYRCNNNFDYCKRPRYTNDTISFVNITNTRKIPSDLDCTCGNVLCKRYYRGAFQILPWRWMDSHGMFFNNKKRVLPPLHGNNTPIYVTVPKKKKNTYNIIVHVYWWRDIIIEYTFDIYNSN